MNKRILLPDKMFVGIGEIDGLARAGPLSFRDKGKIWLQMAWHGPPDRNGIMKHNERKNSEEIKKQQKNRKTNPRGKSV